ncbi:hypothetical protein R1flu_011353 [Riccia fluitans]|uniref:Uncharacterized protein n=1 Tax=Riccia fluitans TaxID=41844 RepID=A0ABD1Z7J9_9MARC
MDPIDAVQNISKTSRKTICVSHETLCMAKVIAEGELDGPSSFQRIHDADVALTIRRSVQVPPVLGGLDPDVLSRQLSKLLEKVSAPSIPLQVLESQQKTCEDLTDRLMEAGATIVACEAELKHKDEEIVALKERLQASKQKLQQEEAKNAWLNEVTDTLRPLGSLFDRYLPAYFPLGVLGADNARGRSQVPEWPHPFHRDIIRKFYMERIAPPEHAATYFADLVQLRRSRLILPFLYECFDRYLNAYECGVPLDERKEMLFNFIKEVDTKFLDSVLDEEDRYPSPYDLRAKVKHLHRLYLRREIADREQFAKYMQQVGARFMRRTWLLEC